MNRWAGIERLYILEGDPPTVQTDGINFEGAWMHADLVDVNRVSTNDVGAVRRTLSFCILRHHSSIYKVNKSALCP